MASKGKGSGTLLEVGAKKFDGWWAKQTNRPEMKDDEDGNPQPTGRIEGAISPRGYWC
jgi:hypothetical protein